MDAGEGESVAQNTARKGRVSDMDCRGVLLSHSLPQVTSAEPVEEESAHLKYDLNRVTVKEL